MPNWIASHASRAFSASLNESAATRICIFLAILTAGISPQIRLHSQIILHLPRYGMLPDAHLLVKNVGQSGTLRINLEKHHFPVYRARYDMSSAEPPVLKLSRMRKESVFLRRISAL